ncbi:hypothetical protein [Haloferax sp. Atlit-12N]|uniref:hypothetical protein n=1 Tax=Haloferax sp. Atlit-12N TaxID=2077203 RepID=UPI001313EA52|nr:hypothetical protein [Haloferax sp. Atlit-12N]
MAEEYLTLTLDEATGVDEVVLGFRKDGEFYELISLEPPVEAEIRQRHGDGTDDEGGES